MGGTVEAWQPRGKFLVLKVQSWLPDPQHFNSVSACQKNIQHG